MPPSTNPFSAYAVAACTVRGKGPAGKILIEPDDAAGSASQPIVAVVPQWLTGSDSGIFADGALLVGTKVYACRTTGDDYIIIGKKELNFHSSSGSEIPQDMPAGASVIPSAIISDGETCIVGSHGSMILLGRHGINLMTPTGSGLSIGLIDNDSTRSYGMHIFHGFSSINAGGTTRSGPVYRELDGRLLPEEDDDNDFNASRSLRGSLRGVFAGDLGEEICHGETPRNIPLSEYRHVVNEFPPYTRFCGFSGEARKIFDDGANVVSAEHRDKFIRGASDKNSLFLDCNQLIEVLGGNIIDVFGNVLDINYMPILFGGSNARVPSGSKMFEEARLLSRRGLGYHFQLSTNTESSDEANSLGNFTVGVDKEGMVRVNIPKSSSTGNIPFISNADFYNEGNSIGVVAAHQSKEEDIPITLRNEKGDVLLPINYMEDKGNKRATGVRYANAWQNFPESTTGIGAEPGRVRINSTKHHNMYAAAEMLIANTIVRLAIPANNISPLAGIPESPQGSPQCFEKIAKNICNDGADLNSPKSDSISRAVVLPGRPAINTGGGTIACGRSYQLDYTIVDGGINSPLGNEFDLSEPTGPKDATAFSKSYSSNGSPLEQQGGRSMHMNLEGSLEASIGEDVQDHKSIVLDTAGSLVAWFGKDKSGRSMVVQTDGDVAFSVGGMSGDSFNPGRFDLRVNVVNKGNLRHHNEDSNGDSRPTASHASSSDTLAAYASDYIISIGQHGLTIAGMNTGAPMIIRNDGNLIVEATNNLILSGTKVVVREGKTGDRPTHKDSVSDHDGELADVTAIPGVFKEAVTKTLEKLTGRACLGEDAE